MLRLTAIEEQLFKAVPDTIQSSDNEKVMEYIQTCFISPEETTLGSLVQS